MSTKMTHLASLVAVRLVVWASTLTDGDCFEMRLVAKGKRHQDAAKINLPLSEQKTLTSVILCANACAKMGGQCAGFSFNTQLKKCMLSKEECGHKTSRNWTIYQGEFIRLNIGRILLIYDVMTELSCNNVINLYD